MSSLNDVITDEGPWKGMTSSEVQALSSEEYNARRREYDEQLESERLAASSWMPVQHDDDIVAAILDGTIEMPSPTLVEVDGGGHLLYEGLVHSVAGESGAGKSLFALQCAIETMNDTFLGHVLWIDFEMNYRNTLLRLHGLGWDIRQLDHFHYVRPSENYTSLDIDGLVSLIESWSGSPVLAVVDSVGEALNMAGKDSHTEEVSEWFSRVSQRLADAGASVLLIDHTPKNGNGGDFAIGSQRKRAKVDVQFMLRKTEAFSTTVAGCATVVSTKDRYGTFLDGTPLARMVVSVQPTRIRFERVVSAVMNPDGTKRYVERMQEVSEFLDENPGATRTTIKKALKGDQKITLKALDQLIQDGFVEMVDPGATYPKMQNLKPYSRAAEVAAQIVTDEAAIIEA